MRKDILKRRHERMLAKRTALVASAQNSNDANELRAINAQIEDLNADIKDIAEIFKYKDQHYDMNLSRDSLPA